MKAMSDKQRNAVLAASTLAFLVVAMGGGSTALAGDSKAAAADVAMVRPLIGETTCLVVKVDPTRLALPDLTEALKSAAPEGGDALRRMAQEANEKIAELRAAAGGQPVYATLGIPLSKIEWPVFFFVKDAPEVDRKRLLDCLDMMYHMKWCVKDQRIVAMHEHEKQIDAVARLDALVPSPREGLAEALEAVSEYPIQVLLLPPDYVRRTVVELMPQLPRQLGGGPSDVLTDGLVWAALGIDPAHYRAELVVQSASEQAARGLAEHLPKMLSAAYDAVPDFNKRIPREVFQASLPLIAPKVDGDRFTVRLAGDELAGGSQRFVSVATALLRRVGRRTDANRFKQILLAMHNYHSARRMFPPHDEDRGEDGKAHLSWRVHILPYMEEADLWREFHLHEPWDSPHNKKLIEKMPTIYKGHVFGVEPGHTTFLAPVGEDTIYGGKKSTMLSEITDGTSFTVMLVEVKPEWAVPWTAPDDYRFDPKDPARGLAINADGVFLTGFVDGSRRWLRGNLETKILLRLFQKSDGQRIDPKEIQ